MFGSDALNVAGGCSRNLPFAFLAIAIQKLSRPFWLAAQNRGTRCLASLAKVVAALATAKTGAGCLTRTGDLLITNLGVGVSSSFL